MDMDVATRPRLQYSPTLAVVPRRQRRGSAAVSPNTSASVRTRRCEPEPTSSAVSAAPLAGVPVSGVLLSGVVAVPAWSRGMAVRRRALESRAGYPRFPTPARAAARAHRSTRILAFGLVVFAFRLLVPPASNVLEYGGNET